MIFGFLRHSLPDDIFHGYVDIHSHILPGVDDGFSDAAKSVAALRFFDNLGFSAVVLTPHFMNEYPNNRENISAHFEEFKSYVSSKILLNLYLGGEYMIDSSFVDRHKEGFLTLCDSKCVLCETSYIMSEPMAGQMLYDAVLDGYEPIIAHPERYVYARRGDYQRWKSLDYKFQLNIQSLSGAYGSLAAEKAISLLNEGMYDYVGTDIHNLDHFIHHIKRVKLKQKDIDKLVGLMENNKQLLG